MQKVKKAMTFLIALLMLSSVIPYAARAEDSTQINWDEIREILFQVMYTGEPADVLDRRIPVNSENESKIISVQSKDPQFNGSVVHPSEYVRIDGVKYYSRFTVEPEVHRIFKEQYDACTDAVATLTRGLVNNDRLSDVDKALILHDRLGAWGKYSSVHDWGGNAASRLVYHEGVCQGITLAYNWLLQAVGIRAETTTSAKLFHDWSRIYIDDKPYYTDLTWDESYNVPGPISHYNFMVSYEHSKRVHRVDDFPDDADSTLYEDYFSQNSRTEVVYANENLYYMTDDQDIGYLIKRTPAGEETELLSFPLEYTHIYSNGYEETKYASTIMTAIGDKIIYLLPFEVRVYDTVTGEDALLYKPSDEIFSDSNPCLTGIWQYNGEVRIYTDYSWSPDKPCESFQFCDHTNLRLLTLLPGEHCRDIGSAKMLCEDCGAIIYKPGEGVLGDHVYENEIVSEETLRIPATCLAPAQYARTCIGCGAIEENPSHLFSYGEPIPHDYEVTTSAATDEKPGYTLYTCRSCGATEYYDFTFSDGCEASGVTDEGFAWQIADSILTVTGSGELPDYSKNNRPPWYEYRGSIRALILSGEITRVGRYCFAELSNMKTALLTDSVAVIADYGFSESSLTEFIMPESLEIIEAGAFSHCSSLSSVVNNTHIRVMGAGAFMNCKLSQVVVPGSVETLGNQVFSYNDSLTSIEIEEGNLKTLAGDIFGSMYSKLDTVRIPSTVETIYMTSDAYGLNNCRRFIVSPNNYEYESVDGIIYTKDRTKLVAYPSRCGEVLYVAPSTLTQIINCSIGEPEKLRFIDLRDTAIENLGDVSFNSQSSDFFVNLPARLTSLSLKSFTSNTKRLFVPSTVTSLYGTGYMNYLHIYTDCADSPVKAYCDANNIECTVLEGHIHHFDEVVYSSGATCEVPGFVIRACECGQFEATEDICHIFTAQNAGDNTLAAGPDCTSPARYYYSCESCGAIEYNPRHTFESGEALGHDWQWITDVEPTCAQPGSKHEACGRCHDVRNEGTPIGATGNHTFTLKTVAADTLAYAATCVSPAKYYYSCSECGKVEKNNARTFEAGNPGPHDYGEWFTIVEPGCAEEGLEQRVCRNNQDHVEERSIPATGRHADNNGDGYCDGCGKYLGGGSNTQPDTTNRCKWCGKDHSGSIWQKIIGFLHGILARIFGSKY